MEGIYKGRDGYETQDFDGRDIKRISQAVPGRDIAAVFAIVVFRDVAAEIGLAVVQRARGGQAPLKGGEVVEGLEGRAGLAAQ